VGGIGSPLGAIAGGYIIAFSELIVTNAWRKVLATSCRPSWVGDGLYQALSTDYKVAVSFTILIIVLLVKPNGLFGGQSR
jgi:branched-chain amino acid transport system permease protein